MPLKEIHVCLILSYCVRIGLNRNVNFENTGEKFIDVMDHEKNLF